MSVFRRFGRVMPEAPKPARRPTIRDVAESAGVSKSLVSLVMRGEPMVREEKRARVMQAAEQLGYRPNFAARSLSAVQSKTVGVLIADLRNPMLVDVVGTAGRTLEDAGLSPLLTSAVLAARTGPNAVLDKQAIGALKDLGVDGMLIVGSVPDRANLAKVVGDVPMVVAAAQAEGLHADEVRNDDQLGMRLVIDYLVANGHRAIAHLGGLGGAVGRDRLAGYREAMAHHGLDDRILVADAEFTEDSGYRGAAGLLRRGHSITAIAAVNDLCAIGALSAIADAGLTVPDDIAVTGYDDTFVAAIRQVSLTSVNPDSAGIGELAARCLIERIADPTRVPKQHLLTPRLVTRSSSPLRSRSTRRT
jgi:DNA-binding LacI/PurR family transcriptional regulator